jgi:hypothetical protein
MKRAMGRVLLFAILLSMAARPAAADDHTSIVLWNVGGQVGMTLGSAVIQHKIQQSLGELARGVTPVSVLATISRRSGCSQRRVR